MATKAAEHTVPKPGLIVSAEAVTAAVAWGAAFHACELYYRTLGTSAGEVGLNVTVVLANLAGVLLALTPSAWVAIVVWSLVRTHSEEAAFAAGVLTFVAAFLVSGLLVRNDLGVPVLTFLGAVFLMCAILNVDVPFSRVVSRSLPTLFGVVLVGGLALCVFTVATASDDAARLDASGRPHGFSMVFNLYARPACLRPLQEVPKIDALKVAHLVLGSRDGMAVLRDTETGRTLRVPESLFQFESVPRAGTKCPTPTSAPSPTTKP